MDSARVSLVRRGSPDPAVVRSPGAGFGAGLPTPPWSGPKVSWRRVRRGSPDPAVVRTEGLLAPGSARVSRPRRGPDRRSGFGGSPDPAVVRTEGLLTPGETGDLRSAGWLGQETLPQHVLTPPWSDGFGAGLPTPPWSGGFGAGLPTPPWSGPKVSWRRVRRGSPDPAVVRTEGLPAPGSRGSPDHCGEHLRSRQPPWKPWAWDEVATEPPGGIALRARPQPPQVGWPGPRGGWGQAGLAGIAPRRTGDEDVHRRGLPTPPWSGPKVSWLRGDGRPSVGQVSRSGDLATTGATIPGSDDRPVPKGPRPRSRRPTARPQPVRWPRHPRPGRWRPRRPARGGPVTRDLSSRASRRPTRPGVNRPSRSG